MRRIDQSFQIRYFRVGAVPGGRPELRVARVTDGQSQMAELLEPEICVIGRGPGAIAAAMGAAALGASALLVRHGSTPHRLRLHAFLAAAASAQAVRNAERFGIRIGEVAVDFAKLKDHVRHVAAAVAPNEAPERLAGLGVRVIDGAPRFTGANSVAVDDHFEIRPKRVVIATGASAAIDDVDGLNGQALTPQSIFDLDECPESLAVIGASAEGLALAQGFLRLGAKVTVIDPGPLLSEDDAECAAVLLRRLQAEGLMFSNGHPKRAAKSGDGFELAIESSTGATTIRVSHVLIARDRRLAPDELDLGAGGIAANASGITVDDYLRSSNPKVFAIGEAAATHSIGAATQHAGLVVRNALQNAKLAAYGDAVPRLIFTDPEFAHVGLGEERARALYRTIRIQRSPFHQNQRAQIERDTAGHVKIVTLQDGTIIGATIVGRGAVDQIASWALAVERGLRMQDLAGWVLPHPSRTEAGKQALTGIPAGGLTRVAPSRIINLLRRRG